jgi:CBS domain-containing protein
MEVRELVSGEVIWIEPKAKMREAAELMVATGVGSLAVEIDGALEGILTEKDILMAVAGDADFDQDTVSKWMTGYPDAFQPEMDVVDAADWMLAAGYRHLPVVDGDDVLGVISIKDVLWGITEGTKV